MASPPLSLDVIRVTSPCTAYWAGMQGSDQVRFCSVCRQNVYDLSTLSQTQAEQLIREKEGRLCVRFFQRPDGRVLTRDCLGGRVVAIRRRMAVAVGLFLSAVFGFLYWAHVLNDSTRNSSSGRDIRDIEPFRTVLEWIAPSRTTMGVPCRQPGEGASVKPVSDRTTAQVTPPPEPGTDR